MDEFGELAIRGLWIFVVCFVNLGCFAGESEFPAVGSHSAPSQIWPAGASHLASQSSWWLEFRPSQPALPTKLPPSESAGPGKI